MIINVCRVNYRLLGTSRFRGDSTEISLEILVNSMEKKIMLHLPFRWKFNRRTKLTIGVVTDKYLGLVRNRT